MSTSQSPEYFRKWRLANPDYIKQWRRDNRDKVRIYNRRIWLKKNYGITPEQIEEMRFSQDSKCAICQNTFGKNRDMCVDHDHSNGNVRQLLCTNCNTGIGKLKENVSILTNAIEYLRKWQNK